MIIMLVSVFKYLFHNCKLCSDILCFIPNIDNCPHCLPGGKRSLRYVKVESFLVRNLWQDPPIRTSRKSLNRGKEASWLDHLVW